MLSGSDALILVCRLCHQTIVLVVPFVNQVLSLGACVTLSELSDRLHDFFGVVGGGCNIRNERLMTLD